jgi:hypothetical protein
MQSVSNKRQFTLSVLLIVQTAAVFIYTILTAKNEGWDLFQVFTSNILAFNWNGQFNLDFSCYLALSGLWIMWRNAFSGISIVLGILAMIIGIMAFAPYLLYLLAIENGDLKKVIIGKR